MIWSCLIRVKTYEGMNKKEEGDKVVLKGGLNLNIAYILWDGWVFS